MAESVWRGRQAGREAEERSRDNPAVARVEQSGVERDQRQEEIDRERFAAAEDHDVDAGLRQLHDLTDRAPTDPDADWYDQLEELYETYAEAWETSGRLGTRLTDGQGNTFTLGEYLATQRAQMEMRRNVRRTLGTIDGILSTTDAGDVEALQALADDPATADLPITVAGPDGKPVQTTVGAYLTNTLIPHTQTRLDTNAALGSVNEITETAEAGDIEALQLLADDPATADLPITVKGPDGEPVQTTVGDYLTNTLIPQTQTRLNTNTALSRLNEITETAEDGDLAALLALAKDPATGGLTITIRNADGEPVETTISDYIITSLLPQMKTRLDTNTALSKVNEITETAEPGDIEALQLLADDPATADLPITVTGPDGEPVQTTVGDYIRNNVVPNTQTRLNANTAQTDIPDSGLVDGIPKQLLELAAASGIDPERIRVIHPKPGSGWGAIGTVYVLADGGGVIGTGDGYGGFSARESTVNEALEELIPNLEGVRVFHPKPGSGWGAIDTVYFDSEGRRLAQSSRGGTFSVTEEGRNAVAVSLGFEGAPSLHGSRPKPSGDATATPTGDTAATPINGRDWSYVEGRNVWIYEPEGAPPERPPEALPRGAEPGGQWTYHQDRRHWYYEPPVADAGVGGAQVQASGSADATAVETGAAASPSDAQSLIENHVTQFLAAGGVLTPDERQRLVELGVLEPGDGNNIAPSTQSQPAVPDAAANPDASNPAASDVIPDELLELAAASGIDPERIRVIHPKPGSGWGAIGTVYVLADGGGVIGTGDGYGGFSARESTVNEALEELIPNLEGVRVFHPKPGSGWGAIDTVYFDSEGRRLAQSSRGGTFSVTEEGRNAVAVSLGFEGAPSLHGSRPKPSGDATATPTGDTAATPINGRDWSYVEGRNVWIYEPEGAPPERPPEALPRGAEPGGQWTYHQDRRHWYYEPPVADAGVGGAQVQASGSADATAVETGAAASPSDAQSLIENHVTQFLAAGGVLTPDERQRLVELGAASYQQDGETLNQDAAQYETEAAGYRTDLDAYESALNAWNENPGNAAQLQALQDWQARLDTEQARLSASADGINARTEAQQADYQRLKDLAQRETSPDNNITPDTQSQPAVPDAGSTSAAAEIFALQDSGSKPQGRLTREQGTGNWYNASELEDDSGINLTGPSYALMNDNTIVADGTVSIGKGTARVQTTYTRNPDGTITTQSRLINYYKDDAAGSGSGGGSSRKYTVADDGTVSYTEGDHTYTVSDDGLAQAVQDAAASGDASGLSSVDQVTVSDSFGNTVFGNFDAPSGDAPLTVVSRSSNGYTTVKTAEGTTVYDSDGNYVASLDSEGGEIETPSSAPPSLAVAIDSIQQSASDGSTKVEVTGVTAADNLTLEDLRPEIATNVAEIVTYALPESSYGGSKGYDLTAEELKDLNLPPDATPAEIKVAVDAYNAENPPESPPVGSVITEAQAVAWGAPNLAGQIVTEVAPDGTIWSRPESPPVGSVITEAQAVAWGNPALAGQTITEVGPDGTITVGSAAESPIESPPVGSVITEAQAALWGDPALAGRTVTKVDPDGTVWSINKDEEQAVADFKSDVATKYMGPDEYTRLAEKWATNPDNALVQVPVYGETDDGYGLLGYQTPSEYFSQMATDPTVVANEAIFEQQRRELPGETGYIGTQVQVDSVTGTLQVSPGVAAIANAQREEQERQEMTLPGETGVIGTQVQVDSVTGTLQVSPGVAPIVNAQREEQERQEMTLPGETGVIGTQVQVDPRYRHVAGVPRRRSYSECPEGRAGTPGDDAAW